MRGTGLQKRLVRLDEVNNCFELKLSSLNCCDYRLMSSLINSRYPRFYTSTANYYQRWRMRYNIFVSSDSLLSSGDFTNESNTVINTAVTSCADRMALHIGEMHLYFDIIPTYSQPVFVNSSFYANKSPINCDPNLVVNQNVVNRITRIVNSIRYSKDIFQFKFPINGQMFERKTEIFDKFMERQLEFIEESVKIYRKNEQKKRKFNDLNRRQFKSRLDTRDVFSQDNHYKYKPNSESKLHPNSRSFNKTFDFSANKENNEFQIEWNDGQRGDVFTESNP